MNNVENDHDSEHFANESNKKNEDSYRDEIESKSSNFHDNQKYNYFLNEKDYHINIDIIQKKFIFQCRKCRTKFVSNNKLHKHVRECRKKLKSIIIEFFHLDENIQKTNRIIVFKTKSNLIKNLIFRSWHFATFATRIFKKDSLNELCADSECIMSLINRFYLKQTVFNVKIHNTDESITIRDIEIAIHNCFEYVKLKLYILDTLKFSNVKKIVKLTRYAHIVNNLRVKFLMKMNILEFEEIILNISRRKMILSLCENLNVNIRIISKLNSKVNRIIFAERFVTISVRTIVTVLIKMKNKIVSNRDYLIQSVFRDLNLDSIDEVMTHMMNINIVAVQICNFTNKSIVISRKARLKRIIEYEEHECYLTDSKETSLVTESIWKKSNSLIESTWRKTSIFVFIHINLKNSSSMKKFMKAKFSNEITIYETLTIQQQLFDTFNKYSLWDKIENIVITVSEDEWMSIILKSEAKIETVKMYSMRFKKRELINETFDKLHHQNKMHWIIEFIFHDASIFVIWRMINEEKKDKIIVDIRELNKIVKSDSYSMFLQIDIISTIADFKYIFVIDITIFFYQFRVRITDKHKLIVVSHREQKYFFVTFMNFKNSSTYAQRRINMILRDLKHCCKVFIDDIIIFSATLEKHVKHLSLIFQRLFDYDIKLNSCKTFLNFSSIALLEQHVDEFDLHAIKNKVVAILNWKFLTTLKALKIYLRFIEWLRNYVAWYAQKVESLQQRKILLLKNASFQKKHARKAYVDRIILKNSTARKQKSFEMIQKTFKNSRFLIHFDFVRQFLINVNAFKKDFEAFIYHVKKNREEITKFTIIKSIVFLSKIFISAKKRYWSTKLKIVAIVWIVKKLHHMIRATKHFIIIWTNHSIIVAIIKQTKMIISNTNKLNFHFVKANMYLSQFDLNVRHKIDRDHVIFDALFRLSFFDSEKISEEITEEIAKDIIKKKNDILKNVNVYVEILVKMFLTFKTRLIQTYEIDKKWFALYVMLTILKTSRI